MKVQARSPDEVADELDLALEIEYSGGFLMSLDVDFIFGRTGYLAVKLKSLKGRLRLQFTRFPCTHWSFSFYEVKYQSHHHLHLISDDLSKIPFSVKIRRQCCVF